MAKYIKCFNCGKKIMFGEVALTQDYIGAYCSDECFSVTHSDAFTVNIGSVMELDCKVFDDEARKEEIRKEMEEHRAAMEKLFEELESLTKQN